MYWSGWVWHPGLKVLHAVTQHTKKEEYELCIHMPPSTGFKLLGVKGHLSSTKVKVWKPWKHDNSKVKFILGSGSPFFSFSLLIPCWKQKESVQWWWSVFVWVCMFKVMPKLKSKIHRNVHFACRSYLVCRFLLVCTRFLSKLVKVEGHWCQRKSKSDNLVNMINFNEVQYINSWVRIFRTLEVTKGQHLKVLCAVLHLNV